jgi:imidazolonepropionase-like amidohydrolase
MPGIPKRRFARSSARSLLFFLWAGVALLQAQSSELALVGARIYPAPDAKPIFNGVVHIRDGRIENVGEAASLRLPPHISVMDCTGASIAAGFWNSHIHFTDPQWENAAALPAARLTKQLERMLTRYGFTTVFDLGSLFVNTQALRARIEAGEVQGPRIFTVGEPLAAKDGTPYYIKPLRLPELYSPAQAAELAAAKLAQGADGIKLHVGAIVDRERNAHVRIAVDLVRAVAEVAHRQGKLVFAHPQYRDGLESAVEGGVDVLAHVTEELDRWGPDLLARVKSRHMTLIPTLKLLAGAEPSWQQQALLTQVGDYARAGGQILFGTDAGFLPDCDPTDEYALMQKAGMSYREILSALTTAPAQRFGLEKRTGRLAPGFDADLVVLSGDPASDVRNFARIRYTLRKGKVIYRAQ